MIKNIETSNAAPPGGHYSQAISYNGLVYLSGILPVSQENKPYKLRAFEEQVKQVLSNADAILSAAGCSRNTVLKSTVYITDISLWPIFNSMYANYFGEHRPARSVAPVPQLHHGFDVEVEMIAFVNEEEQ